MVYRIIHYLPEFLKSKHGVTNSIKIYVGWQKKKVKEVFVAHNSIKKKINKNIRGIYVKHLNFFIFMIPIGFYSSFVFKKNDIFFIHSVFTLHNFLLTRILKKNKIKYILVPHGGYIEQNMTRSFFLKKIFIFLFEKKIVKDASYVITSFKKEFIDLKKIFKVTNSKLKDFAFPLNYIKKEIYSNVQYKKKKIIGYFGRLDVFHKGLDILVKAFDSSKYADQYKLHIFLTKSKNELDKLQNIISKLKNKKNIFIKDPIYGKKKIKILKSYKLFIYPSRYEAYGIAQVESVLSASCIISENHNISDSLKKFNVAYIVKNNIKSISKKIDLFLENKLPPLDKRDKFIKFFSNNARQLHKLHNQLVKKRNFKKI